jgi:hypothetical protein
MAPDVPNPFPGLRPFEFEEAQLFFGREGQLAELLTRLRRERFVAVVGGAGSGKSSLVRAGLLPALHGGMLAEAGSDWRVALLRPGSDPVANLARALSDSGAFSSDGGGNPAAVEAALRRGGLGLAQLVARSRMSHGENLLVIVDQFEEIFRFALAQREEFDDESAAFVKLLLNAARRRDVPVYVVLTMRSDFLGDCVQFWELPEAINDGQYLVPRLTREQRREAIVGPVAVAGGAVTAPLVNRLLNDMGDNPDQLPILQHALKRTWDLWVERARGGEPMGLEHYEAAGGMADALSLHADEAWGELPDERSRLVAEKMFKALTERGADNREIRRPATLGELCEIAEATPGEVSTVVEVFRREDRAFLMPPPTVPLEAGTVIDISHESLSRNWQRLRKWADEESQSARVYRRLAEAAVLHGEGAEGLLSNVGLHAALDWRDREQPNQAWANRYHPEFEVAMNYLDASREHQDAQVAAERERQRRELEQERALAVQQTRSARRLRRLTSALVVLALVAVGTAAFALRARDEAVRSRVAAEQSRKRAEQSEEQAKELNSLLEESNRLLQESNRLLQESNRKHY